MYKYNPKRVAGGWNNVPFEGYMDGTFIEIEYIEKAVLIHVGGDGVLTAILNANRVAKATVTFAQGSPTNDSLTKMVPDAPSNRFITAPFQLKDLNGNTVVNSADAFLEDQPKVGFGKEITPRQWVFYLPDPILVAGGAGD